MHTHDPAKPVRSSRLNNPSPARLFSVLAASIGLAASAQGGAIMPGNLIVYRVGTGASALGTTATAVFLDEYSIAGGLVQSIPLPTSGSAGFTAVGNSSTEGIIGPSQDGTSLVFTGYRKDVGGTSPAADNTTTTNRVIASVGLDGVVNTSIAVADGPTSAIRSATTVNGSSYYVSTSSGVRYIASPGAASTSVQIDSRNSRQVLLADNTLFASNGSNAITAKVQSYGTLPTAATAATPLINLAIGNAVNGISLFDLSPGVTGVDTAYILDTLDNRFYKYSFDGSIWNQNGFLAAGGAVNLAGFVSGGTVNLFLTSGSSILPYADTSGYNSLLTGTLGGAIATAGTNTAFRGIAIAVPEPSTGLLCGLIGAAGLGLRRSRRQNAAA